MAQKGYTYIVLQEEFVGNEWKKLKLIKSHVNNERDSLHVKSREYVSCVRSVVIYNKQNLGY